MDDPVKDGVQDGVQDGMQDGMRDGGSFLKSVSAGVFCVPWCAACRIPVWPPAPRCGRCSGPAGLRDGEPEGLVLEASGAGGTRFGLVDLGDGVRLLAELGGGAAVGSRVRITSCGVRDGRPYYVASGA